MKSLKILAAMAMVVLSVASVSAQKRGGKSEADAEKQIEKRTERLAADLSLTDKQQKELKALYLDSHKDKLAMKAEAKQARELRRAEAQKQKTTLQADFKNILTEEQYVKYLEQKVEKDKKGDKRRKANMKKQNRNMRPEKCKKGCKEGMRPEKPMRGKRLECSGAPQEQAPSTCEKE